MGAFFNNGEQYGGTATTASQVMYNTTESVADKIDELEEKTGEDIPVNTATPNTSINQAINACWGRTGSDIPVSSGETETIAEAIEAIPSITHEDVSGTTGTTQYAGYYYVDVTKTASGYIVGAMVIDSTSNRLAFCQRISATKIRVYSPVADTTVTVRVLLSNRT